MFPLGDSPKAEVRREASARGILVADKPDSHDICFISDGDTKAFLASHLGERPGPVVDSSGVVLGEHDGAYAFTVGQRKGLGLTVATPDRQPRYVLSIEPTTNVVTVGPRAALAVHEIVAERPRWCGAPVGNGETVALQYRAHGETVTATVYAESGLLRAVLDKPAEGVAPGQTLALYDGTRVRGSATITTTS
jgi:tRNA-specific 2-thiouridylase